MGYAVVASSKNVLLECVSRETYEGIQRALLNYARDIAYDRRECLELPSRMPGVPWNAYKDFLRALGDKHVRHIYDQGLLEIMSPLNSHDWIKRLMGRLIEAMTLDQNILIQSIGSTTITSDAAERGFEADESYYVANEPKVRGKIDFEPDIDPPPDLILEIDVTRSSKSRLPLFAAMKVPEIWRHDGQELVFLVRTRRGIYRPSARSKAFPFLAPEDIVQFLALHGTMSENELIRRFVRWARQRRNALKRLD
jgi:Uma2 family endonuclease